MAEGRIRAANEGDVAAILDLVKELATYERSIDLVRNSQDQLREALFVGSDPAGSGNVRPSVWCDVVESPGGDLVGMAVWFLNYSTWTGLHGIYIEDIVVAESSRGLGYGAALLRHLAARCVERGYARLEWSVLDWNTPAMDFYRSLGAQYQNEWHNYRLDGEALVRLGS